MGRRDRVRVPRDPVADEILRHAEETYERVDREVRKDPELDRRIEGRRKRRRVALPS